MNLSWLLLSFQLATAPLSITPLKGYRHEEVRDSTRNWIVLHSDETKSQGATLSYLKRSRKSYHYYINRQGKVYQLVDPSLIANHAGWSLYKGLSHWNKFSIGVCLQNDKIQRYTSIQYIRLNELKLKLRERYPDITDDHIVRHSDIASWRGKHDPGKQLNMKLVRLDNP